MKIAVVNTKGGVGKTTTAIYLATVASAQGKSTELLDADPQGSATSWAEIATEGSAPLPFQVSPANKITLSRASSSDITVIDTPPGAADIIQAAIDAAGCIPLLKSKALPADGGLFIRASEQEMVSPQEVTSTFRMLTLET